jgi:hypothetical protein
MKICVIGAVIFAIIDIIGAFIAVAKAGRYQNDFKRYEGDKNNESK